jgi:hypothetical protein
MLRVSDEGFGMAPELIPRIFDLFTQGERTADRSQGGLGIRLTLVQMLTNLHGGSVDAASDGPGKGSTFTIRLPCIQLSSVPEPPATDRGIRVRRRVLIVEDNDSPAIDVRRVMSRTSPDTRRRNLRTRTRATDLSLVAVSPCQGWLISSQVMSPSFPKRSLELASSSRVRLISFADVTDPRRTRIVLPPDALPSPVRDATRATSAANRAQWTDKPERFLGSSSTARRRGRPSQRPPVRQDAR